MRFFLDSGPGIGEEGSMSVDTKKVTGRRKLHFHELGHIEEDACRMVNAAQVQCLGNWSLGQILKHLATVMHQSVDGVPMRVAWYIRLLGPLLKKRLISRGMPAGFRIPRASLRAMVDESGVHADEALRALREGIARLQSESRRAPHPVFGELTREEWDQVHMRHAELHLSFVVPVS
jgi:hypothetical protein